MMRKRTFYKNIAVSIVLVLVLLFCTQAIRATTISEGSTEDVAKQSTETTEAEPTQDPNPPAETTDSQSDGEDNADNTSDSTESTTVVTETDPTLAESAKTEESTEVKSGQPAATEAADDTTATTETIQKQPVLMMRSARMTVSAQPWNATVNSNGLRLRLTPNTKYSSIRSYDKGVKLQVLGYVEGQTVNAGNNRWYRVKMEPDHKEGYMYSAYITLEQGVEVGPYVATPEIDPANPP